MSYGKDLVGRLVMAIGGQCTDCVLYGNCSEECHVSELITEGAKYAGLAHLLRDCGRESTAEDGSSVIAFSGDGLKEEAVQAADGL